MRSIFYRTLTVSAVLIEPLYSYFVWRTVLDGLKLALQEFGHDPTESEAEFLQYIILPFIIANLICDITSVDPLKDADELVLTHADQEKALPQSKRLFGMFLKFLALAISFPAGASANATSVYDITNKIKFSIIKDLIYYPASAIVTLLGVVYYMMFTNAQIQRHANEFIDVLKDPKEFLMNVIKSPGKYLEVLIQSFFNSVYRAIAFGYITSDFLGLFFKLKNTSRLAQSIIMTTSLTTFLITLFSRTLSVRDKFLNPNFTLVTSKEIKLVSPFRLSLLSDLVLTLIRAGAVGLLVFNFLPLSLGWKLSASIFLGLVLSIHSGYTRYISGLYSSALETIPSEDLKHRKKPLDSEDVPLLGGSSIQVDSIKDTSQGIADDFQEISSSYHSKFMTASIDVINIMARTARFVTFFLFIATFNNIFSLSLGIYDVVALTFLWGAEVFKNDGSYYEQALKLNWTGIAAKAHMESVEKDEPENNNKFTQCGSTLFNVFKAITKSPYDYSPETIQKCKLGNV